MKTPLLTFADTPCVGRFVHRHKRFSVAVEYDNALVGVHSNNSGSMLGLTQKGIPVMLSKANNPQRKLPYTQECVWLSFPPIPADAPFEQDPNAYVQGRNAFWVGVNTSVPNRLLEAAFHANLLPFAHGYTHIKREAKHGDSRLDACFSAEHLPPLWVECKNVTMVEDDVACFPDAVSERGQKHLRTLMERVQAGERAAMFYVIQRPDGTCFGPADVIDPAYAELFWQAHALGVEIYPYRAYVDAQGVYLGPLIPLVR